MARIRSIKPEFWDDRKLARSVSRDARMLYMGLWNQADEHGRLNGDTAWIKGRVFAFDDDLEPDDIAGLLGELETATRIQRYEVDGDPFIFIPKLGKHQRLEPAKVESRLPTPPPFEPRTHSDAYQSAPRADESVQADESSVLLYGSGSMEPVAGSKEHVSARGARIPDEWTPSPELIEMMRAEGVPDAIARRELAKFRDYWAGVPAAKGRKSDWPATWRNWLRKAMESEPTSNGMGRASTKAAGWMTVDQPQNAIEGRTA